jgi:hypothetical protein
MNNKKAVVNLLRFAAGYAAAHGNWMSEEGPEEKAGVYRVDEDGKPALIMMDIERAK